METVVQRIADAVRPERIILFGSRASGRALPDSDIDLLVVYSGPRPNREVELQIQALFPRRNFSMDVVVMSPEELETRKHVAITLAREVSETGVVLHG